MSSMEHESSESGVAEMKREVVGEEADTESDRNQNTSGNAATDSQDVTAAAGDSEASVAMDPVGDGSIGSKEVKQSSAESNADTVADDEPVVVETALSGGDNANADADKEDKNGAGHTENEQDMDDNDEDVDVGDVTQLTDDARNMLFGRGLVYERNGKKKCALKCYLACISHITQQAKFVLLPQCLRNIADLYYRREQYEKAILFIQAEKLFYENALIDTTDIQQKIEALREDAESVESSRSSEDAKIAADSLRADEYEYLAKLCVDKKQPQLALEYAGKATKLRRKIFGNDSDVTKESLDFFATLYAEVGKKQYSDSLSQLTSQSQEEVESVSPSVTPSMDRSLSSILRQRRNKGNESIDKEKKQVRFQEPDGVTSTPEPQDTREHEEFISNSLLLVLFFICFLLLGILGSWLYCSLTDSLACQWMKGEFHYLFMRIKYYYYQYASTKKIKYA